MEGRKSEQTIRLNPYAHRSMARTAASKSANRGSNPRERAKAHSFNGRTLASQASNGSSILPWATRLIPRAVASGEICGLIARRQKLACFPQAQWSSRELWLVADSARRQAVNLYNGGSSPSEPAREK